ncbi:carcinoembryonic antigen-related cell adhesion molecule 6 [Xenopus tropicalis]|uniref:Carcinoembryonic antigen-related cell adhesion molecule 6 n=1 Tax=Xenopus tropicalis TaxID=8364 RepID=A0A8J0T5L8_XENTR|nr:carcinoembryonic antigen-related cell adhesion molecule 6 [Xenopus tropicalis]
MARERVTAARALCMRGYLLTALFSVWINLIYGINIQLIPKYPVVNQPVTLSVSGISETILSFSWYSSSAIMNSSLILSYNPTLKPAETQGPQYFPRASSFSNGSLHIVELSTTDRGYYTVQVQAESLTSQTIDLPVYVPVVKPVIRTSSQRPVEYEEIALTCTAANAQRFLWSRIGGKIPSGVKYSSNNESMIISRITLSDAGKYQCEGMNPASMNISETYTLSLY